MGGYDAPMNPTDPQKFMSPQQVSRFYTDVVNEPMAVNTARKRMDEGWFEDRGVRVEAWGRSLRVVRDDLLRYLLKHHTRAMARLARECRRRGIDASKLIGQAVGEEMGGDPDIVNRMKESLAAAAEAAYKRKGPPPPE